MGMDVDNEEAREQDMRQGRRHSQLFEEGGGSKQKRAKSPRRKSKSGAAGFNGSAEDNADASLAGGSEMMTMKGATAGNGSGSSAKRKGAGPAEAAFDSDAPYTFAPAPRPPPTKVDVELARERMNAALLPELHDAFFSEGFARLQPHLAVLREEQLRRKARGLSANIRRGERKANKGSSQTKEEGTPEDGAGGGGEEKKRPPHVLLTDAEKKANHIASEQKRRANIRKGYEMLCDLVPSLQEGAREEDEEGDEEGGGGGGRRKGEDDDEDDDEDDEDDDDEEGASGKKRKRAENEGSGAMGSKVDGRGGPRSEAIVLMKCE